MCCVKIQTSKSIAYFENFCVSTNVNIFCQLRRCRSVTVALFLVDDADVDDLDGLDAGFTLCFWTGTGAVGGAFDSDFSARGLARFFCERENNIKWKVIAVTITMTTAIKTIAITTIAINTTPPSLSPQSSLSPSSPRENHKQVVRTFGI